MRFGVFSAATAGAAPFVDDDAVVVMARHIKDEPLHFQAMTAKVLVPESIETVLWRVLAKSPADRPASAEQLIAELAEAKLAFVLWRVVRGKP